MQEVEYAGFWIRFVATIIDTVLILLMLVPFMLLLNGIDYVSVQKSSGGMSAWSGSYSFAGSDNLLIQYGLPALIVLIFWIYKSATPGKLITGLQIVDAKTGKKPTFLQFFIRYLGYFLSSLLFCLGFLWVAIDNKKQGFHDKLARTVVIRKKRTKEVVFEEH